MPVITITHWAYLIVVLAIVAAMFLRRGDVMIATIGIFVIGFLHSGSLIRTIQIVFGAFEVAGTDLFDIMLVIALMVAMLRTMESLGADYLMVSPIKKVLGNPTVGFFALGAIMYVCALFFWPTPVTALVGVILVPVAVKAGLPDLRIKTVASPLP